jgi:glucans biosynthesis protein C
VLIFEKILPIAHPFRWPVYMLLAIVFEIAVPKPAIFSFYLFAAMLPLFFLGCLLYRPPVSCPGPVVPVAAALVFVFSLIIHYLDASHRLTLAEGPRLVLSFAERFSLFYLLFRFRWASPRLAVVAGFAYTIYLFHVFGTAGSRIVLVRLGIHDRLLLLAIGTFCGLALPVAIDRVFQRSLVLRRVFLGRR